MGFRVEIEPQAFDDIDSIANYITTRGSFAAAEKWFNGIMDAIAALNEMPSRCAVAAESAELGHEVRLLLHGRRNRTYKIYFSIQHEAATTGLVRIFHVRHWARKPLTSEELEELMDDEFDRDDGEQQR